MSRDYADLERTDIAVYNFRGYTVLRFDKERKELEFGKYAYMAAFITDDLKFMGQFLNDCYEFSMGWKEEINHVEVE